MGKHRTVHEKRQQAANCNHPLFQNLTAKLWDVRERIEEDVTKGGSQRERGRGWGGREGGRERDG